MTNLTHHPADAPWLHIFIVSSEHPRKCYEAIDRIAPDLEGGSCLTVLTGSSEPALGELRDSGPRVRYLHFPGDSVWHLRTRIPALAGPCEWVLALEDHNVPLPDWLVHLREALARTGSEVSAVFGATSNLTSTDPWSWANYLAVQVFHWAPRIHEPLKPLPFNVAIRRHMLPRDRCTLGAYETSIVGSLMRNAKGDASFPVDHIQYRDFPRVLSYHWFNGRATGASIRLNSTPKTGKLVGHLLYVLVSRPLQTRAALSQHPLERTLPAGTLARVYLLAVAHAAGAAYGFLAGPGDSMSRLE